MPVVEELDGLVQRRSIDEGVVRRDRDPQHVRVLVPERAGQIGVDLAEAQHQRLVAGSAFRHDRRVDPREAGQALLRRRRHDPGPRRPGRHRQVQRLQHERRDPPSACAPVVGGMRQDQLVACPGHRDVAEAALLGQPAFRRHRLSPTQAGGQRQGVAPTVAGETTGDEARQVHDGELEALGLVDGQHGHGVGIRIEVGRGRIVAGLDQRLQVLGHEHRPVIGQERGLGADEVEEAGDVAEPLVRRGGGGGRQPRQQAAVAQEGVEHLAGRPLVGHRREAVHVGDQAMDGRPRRRCQSQDAGLPLELVA